MSKTSPEDFRVTVYSNMKEQLAKLIEELKKEMEDYQEAAQEMLDNADVNNSFEDAEDYGVFQGKAEMLEEVIQKLESL